ncbi:alcohol dehydrogenase [candidate division KSB3 bacterium]|uniref:Alcohol dehydrogenase n=1 Tax=candidate division KSB3 bacterium TaxID=2044937 RepID=A0A2G6KBY5_9BACT|nr:MAG: alcohol dehydrogenase [candidate division KSB3 bacterium]
MIPFEFATANRIIFGSGALRQAGEIAAGMGTCALVVTGKNTERAAPLCEVLCEKNISYETFSVCGEPTTDIASQGAQVARKNGCDLVIGFGGGSPLDTGKAIAVLLTNGGEPLDYLEVIGKGQPITKAAAPYLAIPTTAGTGTEVTRNAVLKSLEHKVKVSMRSPLLLPKVALIDPELTYSLPPAVTASTGLDAFTQVLEPYVSHKASPMTDAICREGIARAARSLQRAYEYSDDTASREDMCIASLFGGLALANAGLGAVHGFAGPAGGMFPVPHGVVCARLLPFVMERNVCALQERQPDSPALARYDEIAQILTGNPSATSSDGVTWIQELCNALQISPLSTYGMTPDDIPALVEKATRASSMKGNPLVLTNDELTEIVRLAL